MESRDTLVELKANRKGVLRYATVCLRIADDLQTVSTKMKRRYDLYIVEYVYQTAIQMVEHLAKQKSIITGFQPMYKIF